MKCRFCAASLDLSLVDLGSAPPSNAYLSAHSLKMPEKWFPLSVRVCHECWLVQTEDFAQASELFDSEYAYFSGFSSSWLIHCAQYVSDMIDRLGLNEASHVVEIASNDGCLLQYFKQSGISCMGVEPTASTAQSARSKGISVVEDFFGVRLAKELSIAGKRADLITANNVLAHVPDINDFVAGFATLLKPHGVATFEFPHLLRLVAENQFDTIYHEHFSYLSLTTVSKIFAANGLEAFGVQQLPTHGGSLRVFCQRRDTGQRVIDASIQEALLEEARAGMLSAAFYADFQSRIEGVKNEFLEFLLQARREGKLVAAYGAAAKGNTLLNFAGVRADLLAFVVDKNPAKQGKYLPGSRIPIVSEKLLIQRRPHYVVVLPWNLKKEVMQQLAYIKEWGGSFVTAVPHLNVVPAC
jgi:2-polyprenyl-3-methyl-5-hydroxy-6-metoxy-1,4-benzoquinol methylase